MRVEKVSIAPLLFRHCTEKLDVQPEEKDNPQDCKQKKRKPWPRILGEKAKEALNEPWELYCKAASRIEERPRNIQLKTETHMAMTRNVFQETGSNCAGNMPPGALLESSAEVEAASTGVSIP